MRKIAESVIVVPIDMSEFSLKACSVAADIAANRDLLRFIHVLPVLESTEPGVIWASVDDGGRLEHAKEVLRDFLAEHEFENPSVEIRLGDPGTEIAVYAEEIGAGLIVIPSHGRGILQRMLLGSTTDRVVHFAHCPVLVLKNKK